MTGSPWIRVPPRPADGHKGTFGSVLVVGGSSTPRRMLGGPALSAAAAMRAGCGLCELAMPGPLLDAALTIVPVATGVPLAVDGDGVLDSDAAGISLAEAIERATVVAIGPGLGGGAAVASVVESTLATARSLGRPLVVDADALNAIAGRPPRSPWPTTPPTIVTPHPGEFRRLAAALGLVADPISPERRAAAAADLARRLGAIVVLKGAGTVVCDGVRTAINPTGNAALATGGSGDVLTGLCAGLAAQRFASDPADSGLAAFESAATAVWGHGRAAERAVERRAAGRPAGVLASDLLDEIPTALGEASRAADATR